MQNKRSFVILLFLFTLIFSAANLSDKYPWRVPQGWPEPVYPSPEKTLTSEGIALGRMLFYDPILSKDSSISCSSCHLSYTAFAHVDHALSHGIRDSIGNRNAPALMNLAWNKFFMWDGAVNHLDVQALAPIEHPAEMGEKIDRVIQKINRQENYHLAFAKAFGDDHITGERMLKALAQFQLTLVSSNSKYDKVARKENGVSFTIQEEHGYRLFQKNCASCHTEPLFTSGAFENNGLPLDPHRNDVGRMHITGQPEDSLLFKVPTLRNIEFSFPYMHDGRFKSLYEVLDHYSQGMATGPTLSEQLKGGLHLTAEEKTDIVAFLFTLTDRDFLFNPEFAFPVKNK